MGVREIQQLLKKYQSGKCSKEERDIIENWFASINLKEDVTEEELFAISQRLRDRIGKRIDVSEQRVSASILPKTSRIKLVLRYAAVFVIGVMTVGVTLFMLSDLPKEKNLTISHPQDKLTLPDGSIVILKNDSRLDYPDEFPDSLREVRLYGEAFFEIAKDTDRPFVILTSNLITRVLGTSFNIRAYEHEDSREVEVITGKVLVSVEKGNGELEEVVLRPAQKIIYNQKEKSITGVLDLSETEPPSDQEQVLHFIEEDLESIVEKLNRHHQANIELANHHLKDCRITADLTQEPLEICLEIISRSINAVYYNEENKIIIDGKGCNK